MTDGQKAENRKKPKVRCRVEHVFGFIEGSMGGSLLRSIGMVRAKAHIALTCLIYNMFRYVQICRYHRSFLSAQG